MRIAAIGIRNMAHTLHDHRTSNGLGKPPQLLWEKKGLCSWHIHAYVRGINSLEGLAAL